MTGKRGRRIKRAAPRIIELYASNGNFIGWIVRSAFQGRAVMGPYGTKEDAIRAALEETDVISISRKEFLSK